MRDISKKSETLRTARAESRVSMTEELLQLLREGTGPKGDALPLAKAAAVMAAKKTSDLIPYCHPIPIEHVEVDFEFSSPSPQPSPARGEGVLHITASVTAVAKTGVEMEALTAASIAALTVYDMLKPLDQEMEILGCRLLEKKGGKSSFATDLPKDFWAAVIICSDGVAAGKSQDSSGETIRERLGSLGVQKIQSLVIPDDQEKIRNELLRLVEEGCPLILTTGGTGVGPRDVTFEATREVIERELPGMSEAMRSYGQKRTPYAMFSRGLVGIRKKSLFINLPGSRKGVDESLDAVFPAVFHLYPMMKGEGH